jgi:hypothetical protein
MHSLAGPDAEKYAQPPDDKVTDLIIPKTTDIAPIPP